MFDLTQKARAGRNAALTYVANRKSGLIAFPKFRKDDRSQPVPGFVSCRTRAPALYVAA